MDGGTQPTVKKMSDGEYANCRLQLSSMFTAMHDLHYEVRRLEGSHSPSQIYDNQAELNSLTSNPYPLLEPPPTHDHAGSLKRSVWFLGRGGTEETLTKPIRTGRRGAEKCARCRKQKRGRRVYGALNVTDLQAPCVMDPNDPNGACIPCKRAGFGGSCGGQSFPQSKREHSPVQRVHNRALFGTALYAAAAGGQGSVVQLLIDKGADVNARGGQYGNALHAAVVGGYKAIVELLLEKGADVNVNGPHGNPLQAAAFHGREEIVRLLLEKGADPNLQGSSDSFSDPFTALRYEDLAGGVEHNTTSVSPPRQSIQKGPIYENRSSAAGAASYSIRATQLEDFASIMSEQPRMDSVPRMGSIPRMPSGPRMNAVGNANSNDKVSSDLWKRGWSFVPAVTPDNVSS